VATNFPTSLDALTNPTGANTLASPDHAGQHSDANDAIEALQTKVGVNSSAVVTSLDYKVGLKVDKTTLSTTGDIFYASSANTPARLAIGSSTNVLTVTGGVPVWAAAAGGVNFSMKSGRSYALFSGPGTAIAATLSQTVYTPFFVTESTTFDQITIRAVSQTGTAVVRLGIYNSTNYEPSTVSLNAGTVSVTASATNYGITISHTLAAGMYWIAFNMQTSGTGNGFLGQPLAEWAQGSPYNSLSSTFVPLPIFTESSITGAFATAVPVAAGVNATVVTLRKA
jgi:hypothetical protein